MERAVHDVGGRATDEPVPREQHPIAPWEVRTDALMWVLTDASQPGGRRMSVDELRRGIESLSAEEYASLGYYERWLTSLVAIMTEKGMVDAAELTARADELAREHEAEHRTREHEAEHGAHVHEAAT